VRIEVPSRRVISEQPTAAVDYRQPRKASAPLILGEAFNALSKSPESPPFLKLSHATRHNLKELSVAIPLERFVCITGVSGSGKTTLVREVLLPALMARIRQDAPVATMAGRQGGGEESDDAEAEVNSSAPNATVLDGAERLGQVILVDQTALGKTPRSNPAVYVGAFDDLRELFAQSPLARQRGMNASAFSFNSAQGQCERCRGAGFEKIEMQFLSDVFIRCPDCDGRRYRGHVLEIKLEPQGGGSSHALSIADLLEVTIDEAVEFLAAFADSRHAQRATESLRLLQEVGLGYLKLGQPINTLSGGESQRLKLVRHLAEANVPGTGSKGSPNSRARSRVGSRNPAKALPSLFLFDEPTTGLHFDDVRVLLKVFQRLVDAGHSVLVIEHNLDVIKSADWLIDLGPGAGDEGGRIVACGTPEEVCAVPESLTGVALRPLLS
jgi:excinuclease ABC subunit A